MAWNGLAPLDWRLGPAKVGHKNAKTLPLVTSPRRTLNPKMKIFFFSRN